MHTYQCETTVPFCPRKIGGAELLFTILANSLGAVKYGIPSPSQHEPTSVAHRPTQPSIPKLALAQLHKLGSALSFRVGVCNIATTHGPHNSTLTQQQARGSAYPNPKTRFQKWNLRRLVGGHLKIGGARSSRGQPAFVHRRRQLWPEARTFTVPRCTNKLPCSRLLVHRSGGFARAAPVAPKAYHYPRSHPQIPPARLSKRRVLSANAYERASVKSRVGASLGKPRMPCKQTLRLLSRTGYTMWYSTTALGEKSRRIHGIGMPTESAG